MSWTANSYLSEYLRRPTKDRNILLVWICHILANAVIMTGTVILGSAYITSLYVPEIHVMKGHKSLLKSVIDRIRDNVSFIGYDLLGT